MSRLSRWSRRKLGDDVEEEAPAESPATTREDAEQAVAAEPEPGSLDATLPDPESLPAGSDFTAFLQSGVSDALRRRALRRMFSGDHYGIRDGLDDYDDDYRQRLKPLASEMAQRLRQWTRELDENEPEPETRDPAEEVEVAEVEAPHAEEPAPPRDEEPADARRAPGPGDGSETSLARGD
ncbi:DUF3306 domain-containing protein [Halomonas sp. C05BenzN]|uniref:DUF3306 domain-containing protein n=1 Tax=Halomonas sp. C05BenzN TaxID=3411041 RepID=UPI003B93BFCF